MVKRFLSVVLLSALMLTVSCGPLTAGTAPVNTPPGFILTSEAFEYGRPVPPVYGYEGGNASPPLRWEGEPEGTVAYALIMEDPAGGSWSHWVIFDIPVFIRSLAANLPHSQVLEGIGIQGMNDYGDYGYGGPSPPSGTHKYYFRLYALDAYLKLEGRVDREGVRRAMEGHILGQSELMGTYKAQ